jgi:hypothetical protein
MDRDSSNQGLVLESAELPDLLEWERRPGTQMVPEKAVVASPYVGGSEGNPRDIRTLRRGRFVEYNAIICTGNALIY